MSNARALKALTRDYIHLTLVHQQLSIIDELLTPTTHVNTEFGPSIGKEGLRQNYRDWFSIFHAIQINITDVHVAKFHPETIFYQLKQTAIHGGPFKGIPPTGRQITFDTCVMYRVHQHKIVDYQVSGNLHAILEQISPEASIDLDEILMRPLLYQPKQAITTLQAIAETSKLSTREIECLSLYLNAKSAKSIAQLLGISHRTVEFYLSNAMAKMHCTHKQTLIDKILHLGLKPLFDQQLEVIYHAYTKRPH